MTETKDSQTTVNDLATWAASDARLTQPRSPDVRGYTYFIRDAQGIKIGRSIHPKSRMWSLQSGNGSRLELLLEVPYSHVSESDAHQKFAHLRIHREWFRPEQELLDFIGALKAKYDPKPQRERRRREPKPAPTETTTGLLALRDAYGFNSPVGHRCSNLAEALPIYQSATDEDQKARLVKSIKRWTSDLAKLTASTT